MAAARLHRGGAAGVVVVALALAALLPRAAPQETPSPSPVSASPAPTTFLPSCDASGSCYVGLRTPTMTWFAAATACVDLGDGWALATLWDAASVDALVVQQNCFGTLPKVTYWLGLYDAFCCNRRRASQQNRSYDGWRWASGHPTAYFTQFASTLWGKSQPDNSQGSQGCTDIWTNDVGLMDDLGCSVVLSAACCMHFPPSPSPTVSLSSTASLTVGASASYTATGTATPAPTTTSSPSMYVQVDAPADTTVSGLVGGLVAAIVVGACVAFGACVLLPALAIWRRRQQAMRGGALRSSARIINSKKRDASLRSLADVDNATLNPVAAAVAVQVQMGAAPTRVASAPRLATPSAVRRPSARMMVV